MKSNIKVLMAAASAMILLTAASAAGDVKDAKSRQVTVGPGETQQNIFSIGGNVIIEGAVERDVVAIGGSITVSGQVRGSVVGLGSVVLIKSTARIDEDIAALGGSLEKEPGCVIQGETVYVQTAAIGERIFRQGPLMGLFSLQYTPFFLFLKLALFIIWALLAGAGALLIPRQLESASSVIRNSFWPVFGTGFLAVIIFTGLILVSTLLSIILIGIPLLMAAGTAGLIIKVFGQIAVFHVLGRSFLNAIGTKATTAVGIVLTGLTVATFLNLIPVFGTLFNLAVGITAWGAAIRTKFGTTENWFSRCRPLAAGTEKS